LGLAYNYVEPALAEQLLEVVRMANVLEDLLADTLVQGQVEASHQAVLRVLAARFGPIPVALRGRIERLDEVARLQDLVTAAAAASTLAAFEQQLDR